VVALNGNGDAHRCLTAFPDEYKSLVPKVLTETMSELNSSFVSRINIATGDVIPETRSIAKGNA
jgi:conserved oligomeric Golgi complex subunit 7